MKYEIDSVLARFESRNAAKAPKAKASEAETLYGGNAIGFLANLPAKKDFVIREGRGIGFLAAI